MQSTSKDHLHHHLKPKPMHGPRRQIFLNFHFSSMKNSWSVKERGFSISLLVVCALSCRWWNCVHRLDSSSSLFQHDSWLTLVPWGYSLYMSYRFSIVFPMHSCIDPTCLFSLNHHHHGGSQQRIYYAIGCLSCDELISTFNLLWCTRLASSLAS